MRILHVITSLGTGGTEMMLFKLLSAGSPSWTQAVVCIDNYPSSIAPRIAQHGFEVHSLGVTQRRPNPLRAISVIPIVHRFAPDLIQGWMYHGNLIASFAAGWLPRQVPVIWNIQQSLYDISMERWMTALMIRMGKLISRRPARIVYNSRTGARQHAAFGYSAARTMVIPTGYDLTVFHPDEQARNDVRRELGVSDEHVLVGLVARYHPMKDHAGFLQAARLVAQAHPEARFVLVGRDMNQHLPVFDLIRRNQLEDRVLLLGERQDIPRLTAALDIACSASAWGEGFSNTVGEAMACGIPCVVTDVGDSAYAVGEAGLAVPPRHPQALADAISKLIAAGPECRVRLGQAARRRVQSEFALPNIVRRYEDLYQECISEFLAAK
jgi:glycosyltransferase involved in cell wall biosynthesis